MERPDPKDLELRHETEGTEPESRGRFELLDRERTFAELVYIHKELHLIAIVHTEVDPMMGGLGLGKKLLQAAVEWARETETKIQARCSFALAQFTKDESIRDVYVEG